jgi:hypothetical protein
MSMTDPARTRSEPTEVRGRATDSFERPRFYETKPSFLTTEFWVMILGMAALAAIYWWSEDLSFDLWRATALGTVLAVGYIVSRGFAKSGSQRTRYEQLDRYDRTNYS